MAGRVENHTSGRAHQISRAKATAASAPPYCVPSERSRRISRRSSDFVKPSRAPTRGSCKGATASPRRCRMGRSQRAMRVQKRHSASKKSQPRAWRPLPSVKSEGSEIMVSLFSARRVSVLQSIAKASGPYTGPELQGLPEGTLHNVRTSAGLTNAPATVRGRYRCRRSRVHKLLNLGRVGSMLQILPEGTLHNVRTSVVLTNAPATVRGRYRCRRSMVHKLLNLGRVGSMLQILLEGTLHDVRTSLGLPHAPATVRGRYSGRR